jgi:hypothetical protein
MEPLILNVITSIVELAVFVFLTYALKFLQVRLGQEKFKHLMDVAPVVIQAVEKNFPDLSHNEQVQKVLEELSKLGFTSADVQHVVTAVKQEAQQAIKSQMP